MMKSVVSACASLLLFGGSAFADIDYWRFLSSPGFVRALAVDPSNPAVLYAGLSNAATYYGEHGELFGAGVYRSSDGGDTWQPRNFGLTDLHVTALVIDPTATSTVYAGTDGGGVFVTTDAGLSWTPRNNGLGNPDVYALAMDPQNPLVLYAGLESGGVFRSVDGAATWTPTTGHGNLTIWQIAIDPVTPTTAYIATDLGVRKSTDGGATWFATGSTIVTYPRETSPTTVSAARVVVVDASAPSTVYAGLEDAAGVFKSTNGGTTWVHSSKGLLSPYNNWRFIETMVQDPLTPTTLYASSTRATYRSIDAGATWVVFNSGLSRAEGFAFATHPSGGVWFGTQFGDVHKLTTRTSGVDHFRCFKAKARGFVPATATVTDRFGTALVRAVKPYRFCTPTSVSGDPIADSTTHLACYLIIGPPFPRTEVGFLSNRLDGYRADQLIAQDTLCVSAEIVGAPSAQPRDSYRCLRSPKYRSETLDLTLLDAFGAQAVRDTRLDRLCVPADVDGSGRLEPDVDLRCDKLQGRKPSPVPASVTIQDRFGTTTLLLKKPDSQCTQALESRD